jgi:hypothetical protein
MKLAHGGRRENRTKTQTAPQVRHSSPIFVTLSSTLPYVHLSAWVFGFSFLLDFPLQTNKITLAVVY